MRSSPAHAAIELARLVRGRAPLIHQITNFVVMNFTANVTLALGAQPVMAHAPEEVEEMVGHASALVLNIGTLERAWIEAMVLAGKAANRGGAPVVLDPVGAGATRLRTDAARRILGEVDIAVVRGNAGEILALSGDASQVRGVDSTAEPSAVRAIARELARERAVIVAVTGPIDIVTDGKVSFEIANGHPLMGRVTGTGCAATSAIGCSLGVAQPAERCLAAACALARFGLAGEVAARAADGPGSFVPAFIDALAVAEGDDMESRLRLTEAQ
jgi:hydroxyethylthiazole kinase